MNIRNRSSKYFTSATDKTGTDVCIVLENGAYRVEVTCDFPREFNRFSMIECTDRAHALEVASKACRQAIRSGKVEDVNQRSVTAYAA